MAFFVPPMVGSTNLPVTLFASSSFVRFDTLTLPCDFLFASATLSSSNISFIQAPHLVHEHTTSGSSALWHDMACLSSLIGMFDFGAPTLGSLTGLAIESTCCFGLPGNIASILSRLSLVGLFCLSGSQRGRRYISAVLSAESLSFFFFALFDLFESRFSCLLTNDLNCLRLRSS